MQREEGRKEVMNSDVKRKEETKEGLSPDSVFPFSAWGR